ncbi:MAG: BspA family leucine-rich repeat surface protein, partial [Porticoccaceae bacterium]|nr:BspA family leucine-rich repeat surface protein [Porticoccaceae bacterium]
CLLLAGLWATPAEAHGSHTTSHPDNSCYQEDNIGTVGTQDPCKNMLIVCQQYDDNWGLPSSCPQGKREYSIHRPSQQGVDWTWTFDTAKQDYYKTEGSNKYYFGQHGGKRQIFTGQVTYMYSILNSYAGSDADKFNADIGNWDTSHVLSMSLMFNGASAFNQDIGGWDTSTVEKMSSMFYNASVFNQDIGGWDTSQVKYKNTMFYQASAFNQDIGHWDISQVENMYHMFVGALAFNQDLSHWNLSGLNLNDRRDGQESIAFMFYDDAVIGRSALSVNNYDSQLISWQQQLDGRSSSLQDQKFAGSTSRFCEAATGSGEDPSYWQDINHYAHNVSTIYDCHPRITRVTLAPVGSTLKLTVTFSEPVFSKGGGALEADDFVVSITTTSGSNGASLGSLTSISQNGNSYTLGVTISGTLQDDQVIKVLPAAADRIFDAGGNASSDS